MTSIMGLRAFVVAGLPFAMPVDRQREYLPRLWLRAARVVPFGGRRSDEMMFEGGAPRAIVAPFSASAEQIASIGLALDEMPAEDMHRAVSNISIFFAEKSASRRSTSSQACLAN